MSSADETRNADPHVIVLFGARGDLSKRKLLPGLWSLWGSEMLPSGLRLIGTGRSEPDGGFAALLADAAEPSGDCGAPSGDRWGAFVDAASFVTSDADDGAALAAAVRDARAELGDESRTLLYLSVPPTAMRPLIEMVDREGLIDDRTRIVLEKPFGHDLASAQELNAVLHDRFPEESIFRIDHFLGKEGVQEILALRFANGLFEPIWNNRHIASVQIDVPEELGLEGRAAFYEGTGALRDMVVTHLSQVLGFVAMEPPTSLESTALHDAKARVFDSLRPFDPASTVYGQFEGYRDEEGVDPSSAVPTFVALRAEIDDDRWRGVPFFLRTGKALAAGQRLVTIALRESACDVFGCAQEGERPTNEILIELDDEPRVTLEIRAKMPGPMTEVARVPMVLDIGRQLERTGLPAYQRLIHDVMLGDRLLFTRSDEIERLWACAQPLLDHPPEVQPYAKGSWGPEAASKLPGGAGWRLQDDAASTSEPQPAAA